MTRRPVPWKTWFSSKTEVRCGCPSYDSASMAHPVTFCRYRKLRPVSHPVTSHSFVGMAREGPPCPLRENVAIKKEKQKKEKEKRKQNLRKPGNKSVHDSMRTWLHSALSGPAGYQGLSHVQQNYTDTCHTCTCQPVYIYIYMYICTHRHTRKRDERVRPHIAEGGPLRLTRFVGIVCSADCLRSDGTSSNASCSNAY